MASLTTLYCWHDHYLIRIPDDHADSDNSMTGNISMAILQKLIDEKVYPLNLSQLGIGRAADNEIVIIDDAVSSYHALITVRESAGDPSVMDYILEDLDSTNSTYVNNKAIKLHKLRNGDIVRVGETRLKFLTVDYETAAQEDFQKTRKLSKHKLASFVNKKSEE